MAEKDVVDIRVESEDGSSSNAEEHLGASLVNPRYSTWSDHSRNSYRNSYRDSIQKPARTRMVKQWSQRSLSDLQAESPPGTPGPGTPMSTLLSPPTTWLPSDSGISTPMPTPLRSQESIWPLFPDTPETFFKKDRIEGGSIAQLHDRDDFDFLPRWKRYAFYLAPFLAIMTLALYWLYFALRIRFILDAQEKEGVPFPLAWVFVGVELSVAFPVFLQSFWSIFILKKRNRAKLRLLGNDVPTVDVFITCCREDDDLVLDTTRAACDLDYPLDRFRVIMLDDGKSEGLRKAVKDLQETYPNLHYVCRPKFPGVPHYFKAGNLNYGLDHVLTMPGGAGRFMAALDADMIPEQDWLRAMMPHMLMDDKMALACPPQLFYNVPPSDPLCQSLDFFVHVSEPIKDALGVAWCTGSGYVVRRDALDEIGNFPCGSLAEDVATSTLLLGRGWKTAYIHESLQYGTVPDTYSGHIKQRTRWAIGTVDTSFKLKFCLWGDKIKKLTIAQRMSSFIYAMLSLFNVFLMLSLFAMPIVLVMNKPLVAYATDNELRWLIRACFGAFFSNRFCELCLFIPSGYATGQRGSRAQLWMSPYIAITIVRSFVLPTWLGGQKQAFKPSGSLKSDLNERDASTRAPVWRRLWVIIFNYTAWFHISYVYFCMAAVVLSSYRCLLQETVRDKLVCLLTHAFWPPLTWVIVVTAFWVPITYACDPPTTPARESLLVRDPKTNVAHPTPASKRIALKPETVLFEVEYIVTSLFTALVFGASFFY